MITKPKHDWSNREFRLQYYKDHYRKNRKKVLKEAKKRFKEDKEFREAMNQYRKEYRKKNKDKVNKRERGYYLKLKEKPV